jgi:FkbM family methyltransferase
VEANPVSFELLERFCALNGLTNVRRLQFAVTDRPGTVHIETGEQWALQSILSGAGATTVPVPGITVDGLCEMLSLARVDFLKMNIEGAERPALDGMQRTVERLRYASIACHDFRAEKGDGEQFRTVGAVAEFLRRNGMTVVRRDDDPRPWARDHLHAYRAVEGIR